MTHLRQFGECRPGLDYRPRQGAYGILLHEGRIACAQIGYGRLTWDLPGGEVDPGETPQQALKREFLEETGLDVSVGPLVTELNHYFLHQDGTPYNNLCRFYECEKIGDRPQAKSENDHELVWLPPLEVIKRLKNEGYAWAFILWLRRQRQADAA